MAVINHERPDLMPTKVVQRARRVFAEVADMIKTLHSYPECGSLLDKINQHYKVGARKMYLYRDMIGSVYFLDGSSRKYVFKLFRCGDTDQALQSLDVVQYLSSNGYPVVSVLPTDSGEGYMLLNAPEGKRVGILYDFLEGAEPNLDTDSSAIGQQIAKLHNLMAVYPKPLVERGKDFFIDRFIAIMRQNEYDANKIGDLAQYGSQLWHRMEQLPNGFCHGDLHSGNMIELAGKYILFDFDVASHAYPIIDVATLCDKTRFNHLDESAYENTRRMFDKFYLGYSRERTLSALETEALFDFIAVRHYELNATIISYRLPLVGRHWSLTDTFDKQYKWLMKWKDLCDRRKSA